MIRGAVFGLVSAVALIGSAHAADMYRAEGGLKDGPAYIPVNTWTGFYVGVNGGYGWNNDSDNITSFIGNYKVFTSKGFDSQGAFGGGQLGYNWQRGQLVLGVETDLQGSGIEDDTRVSPVPGFTRHLHQSLDWFGTVRGRVGYAFDRALVYATGGFAYGRVDSSVNTSFLGTPIAQFGKNDVETGFVVGGGLEYKIAPSWSIKGEYQFIDLGSQKLTGSIADVIPLHSNDVDNNFHTVRVGVNYHINQGYEPLK